MAATASLVARRAPAPVPTGISRATLLIVALRARGLEPSYLALLGLAEQSLGTEEDHDDEEQQGDPFLVCRRDVEAHDVLEDADEDAAEEHAAGLIESADD